MAISTPTHSWIDAMQNEYETNLEMHELREKFELGKLDLTRCTNHNGLLFYKGRLYIASTSSLRTIILKQLHESPIRGHSGFHKTLQRVKADFYWQGLRSFVRNYVKECDICPQMKREIVSPAGLLQPLPIPEKNWTNIAMDFIEGLPCSHGYEVIMIIVDHLSKYAHFLPLSHPYRVTSVAKLFLDNVFKLHGMPLSSVNDRDPVFTSAFWKELFRLQDTHLKHSSAYHPQTDRQSEVVNQCLETYLRCFIGTRPLDGVKWQSLAEWWYNTNFHLSPGISPFNGTPPPCLLS